MEEEVRYCRRCGKKLATGVAFCTDCGTPVNGPLVNPQVPQQEDNPGDTAGKVAIGVFGSIVGVIILSIIGVIVFTALLLGACILGFSSLA